MPPVILGAALLSANAITLATFALTAISYGVSQYAASRARSKARRAFNDALEDRLVMTATVDRARTRCYGRVRNTDGILFKATYGDKRQFYCIVSALAGHEIDGLEQVYFGDTPVTLGSGGLVETSPWNGQTYDTVLATIPAGEVSVTLPSVPRAGSVQMVAETADGEVPIAATVAGSVVSSAGDFGSVRRVVYQAQANRHMARVQLFNGGSGQDLSESLAADFPDLITPGAHRFAGIACMRVDLSYSQDVYPNGVPQISAVFRGAKVLDPRLQRLTNAEFIGAGVGGLPGTGLALLQGSGIAAAVVGVGLEGGLRCVDVRVHGTASAPVFAGIRLGVPGELPSASAGQTWHAGVHMRTLAGSAPVPPSLDTRGRSSGGADTESGSVSPSALVLTAAQVAYARVHLQHALTNPATAALDARVGYQLTSGQTLDVTLRIALPTLSQGVDAIRWTESPSLIARDWAVYANGGGACSEDLHESTFVAAANVCDVTHAFVSVNQDGETATTVRPMYTCGIVCDTAARPDDTLAEIVESMAGAYAWTGGRLRVKAGAYSAPVATITADWLSDKGSIEMVKDAPVTSLVNVITPTIADAAKKFVAAPLPRIAPAAYIEEDGQEHPREDSYAGVTDADHAGHVAGVSLRDSRAARTYRLPCNLLALSSDVFDTHALNIPEIGATGEAFEIQGTELDFSKGLVWLSLKATAASIFDPDAEFRREDALINNAQANPFVVPPLALLPLESGTDHLLLQADGTIISRLCVKWAEVDDEAVINGGAVEIRCGRPGTDPSLWQTYTAQGGDTQLYITAVQDGAAYAVIGRCRNKLVAGDWSVPEVHVIVGKSQRPATVTGLGAVSSGLTVLGGWDASTEVDYKETELRAGPPGADWDEALVIFVGAASGFVWQAPDVGTYNLLARHRDRSGNESLVAAEFPVLVSNSSTVKLLRLSATSNIIKIASGGAADPASITLAAQAANISTGVPVFTVTGGTATLVGSGLTRTLAAVDMITDVVTISVSWDGLTDVTSIVKVRDGVDGTAGGSGSFNWLLYGAAAVTGNSLRNSTPTGTASAAGASVESYLGGAQVSFKVGVFKDFMSMGLGTSSAGGSPDYGWTFFADGSAIPGPGGTITTATTADAFSVAYDGANIKYSKSGTVVRTVAVGADITLYLAAQLNVALSQFDAITFAGAVGTSGPRTYRQESDPGAVPEASTWTVPSTGKSYIRQSGAWTPSIGPGGITTTELQTQAVSTNGVTLNASTSSPGSGLGDTASLGFFTGPTITLAAGDLLDVAINGMHSQKILPQLGTTRVVDMFRTEIWMEIQRGAEAAIEVGTRVLIVSPAIGPNLVTPIPIPFAVQATPGAGAWTVTCRYRCTSLTDQGLTANQNNGYDSAASWRFKRLKR